ncbi:solute carrier family 13 member 5 isoform X1 [Sceloporus undulatus]|uniref:solute carrier family 13 member 5 isoform X1 n=1 Tax=Sceloporus undulatus TaxID=8520 RepID=UPI001C4C5D8B|nr:solute carrier family 13 member 5 isoform X1 [Sceloporus undulatus]
MLPAWAPLLLLLLLPMAPSSASALPAPLRALLRYRGSLALFGAPLALLPLPLLLPGQEARCGYVILLMAIYWCTEVIPLAATALLPVVLFPMLGILESKKVCMQYLKDTNMLFVGGLIVAVAVERWNLHKRIALRVLLTMGVKPALLMLGFMGVTAFLSMWISNTATTAMMVPIVQAVLDQMNSSEPEPVGQEMPTGHLNPSSGIELGGKVAMGLSSGQGNSFLPEDPTDPKKEAVKRRINKGMTLCICYAASIGGTATLTGTGPNLVLKGQMNQLFPENGDVLNFASWFGFAFPNMLLMLLLAWVWLQVSFMGFNFRKTWGCGSQQTELERAALRVLKEEHRKLGPISFAECNVLVVFTLLILLWFTRDPGFIPGWATVLFNKEKEYVTDATVAIFVALLLFILPATRPKCGICAPSSCDLEEGEEAMKEPLPPAPLLDWKVVHRKLPWSIVLLLGGGFALANGSEVSGLSKWLGDQMTPLHSVPPWAIAIILSLVIAIFTECTSNVATATLFLPVFASLSQSIGVNPLYIMIPCTLSASFAFMLPVATPPNAIVFSYGHLRISDMAKTGIVMNIIGVLCITLAINSWGRAMFHLDSFPAWANTTLGE